MQEIQGVLVNTSIDDIRVGVACAILTQSNISIEVTDETGVHQLSFRFTQLGNDRDHGFTILYGILDGPHRLPGDEDEIITIYFPTNGQVTARINKIKESS